MTADTIAIIAVLLIFPLLVLIGRRRTMLKRLHILSIFVVLGAAITFLYLSVTKHVDHWDAGKWCGCRVIIYSGGGTFTVFAESEDPPPVTPFGPNFTETTSRVDFLGFHAVELHSSNGKWIPFHGWCVPYWFPFALTLFIEALLIRRYLRNKKPQAPGVCLHCSYDLRASKERCPECGNPISH